MFQPRFVSSLVPLLLLLGVLVTVPAAAEDDDAGAKDAEAALLVETLQSEAATFDKAKACYRLAVIGDERAVPALAPLLRHADLSNYARHALERIAGDRAKGALRSAIDQVDGELLLGVIGSLGFVRDADSVEQLSNFLASEDPAVADASTRALGRIANVEAAEALLAAFGAAKNGPEFRRNASAMGCVLCAQTLALNEQGPSLVTRLCDAVRKSDVASHVRLPAVHNAIVLRGSEGITLLRELLESDNWADFQVAMRAARELDVDVSKELIARFDDYSPSEQAVMLSVLSDLGNPAAVSTMMKAARQGEPAVRVQAFRALARLADETALPVLVAATRDRDAAVAKAARAALVQMSSSSVDDAVLAMLSENDLAGQRIAIDLASRRLLGRASPKLWELTEHRDKGLRIAALRALGTTARMDDWPRLIAATTVAEDSDERQAARAAANDAGGRIATAGSTEIVGRALQAADPAGQVYLLELLGQIGGPGALAIVVDAAKSDDDARRDAATRVLGNWMTADVAPALYELATTYADKKYRIRTLRGYIRVARQLSMPIGERLDLCENALQAAGRPEEKLLVLDVLRVHAVPRGMKVATGLLDDEDSEVMEQAARVIVILARGYVREFPSHAEAALVPALAVATNERVQTVGHEILSQARELLSERESE